MPSRWGRCARFAGLVVVVPLALWLGAFLPQLVFLFLALWIVALCLDVLSTWRMHRLDPERFPENESNTFFVALHGRLGFKRSVPAFLALVEIPRFAFVALVCAPLIGDPMPLSTNYFVGLGVAAAAQGYAHLDGWRVNRAFVSSKSDP